MWQFISETISEVTGNLFVCQHRQVLHGTDSHQSVMIRDDARRYFVKYRTMKHPNDLALDAEAEGLAALAATQCIKTPAVICQGVIEENGGLQEYLVLQFLKLQPASGALWWRCGEQLALMHRSPTTNRFGWHRHNFIGQTRQTNEFTSGWAQFFAEYRIGVMLESLARQGHKWCNIDVCVTRIHTFLQHHQPLPSLVHGDLWHGNIGFCHNQPVIYDPAVYIGDRETDIAMTELFGKLPEAFYEGYQSTWPLEPDYAKRRKLYQLYHVLNHAVLFGGQYLITAQQDVNQICQQL
ncbi:fructosamine kinase family protein [Alteromonas sp. AMM-1]|uniref:fructosamine kinase family protein n=1 Tax=Alteromonas sp. AMM-1 TaxID=3394233 RepID=UPI0039A6FB52